MDRAYSSLSRLYAALDGLKSILTIFIEPTAHVLSTLSGIGDADRLEGNPTASNPLAHKIIKKL